MSGPMVGSADLELEAAVQTGTHADREIRAFMFTAESGYRFSSVPTAPRISLGLDYSSGDGDPTDNRVKTFNQLFPLGYAYLGYIDVVGRQNIIDFRQDAALSLTKKTTLTARTHSFWRADTHDALYNAGGAVGRAGDEGDSAQVGFELDLTATCRISRQQVLTGGYSHLFPGAFIEESGPSEGKILFALVSRRLFEKVAFTRESVEVRP